ncbi:beta-ketoacyl synthase N-terminal-like domain-containing protein [Actinokineospora guangxiensis]|uniref:Beta-ketoacyl synthase N-terminal-like domain-containing protein n=1 Tax=Actinokineospora guangxiensis TaxID=1490288 RepID=A0ABW0EQB5_9PSEU
MSTQPNHGGTEMDSRIAVIGLAVRLPGAEDATDLRWLLGRDTVEVDEVPPSRWAKDQYLGDGGHQGSHHRGAFLQDPFSFDHEAFGLAADEAVLLDPQQRMMLEVGARALEDSGYLGGRRLKAGVFVGARMNSYGFDKGRGLSPEGPEGPAALWGRSQNFMAAWLSDRLDLAGPSLVVDTACSSSLTAVWLACQSLAAGSCELAVVGGVDLLIDPLTYVLLSRTGALGADGLCHTFDEKANGYVPGEGAVALILKPMAAALADGDMVLGAIVGSGVNNDGRTMGVTTPNMEAQIELLSDVYSRIDPKSVQYIEAHGTGTAIGDPIEVRALAEVFAAHGVAPGSVALGSVKRRIGHLHSAAGMAGLAKLVACLHEARMPATAVEAPNPRLRLDTTPFYLPTEHTVWPGAVRRAAISGFGFGGTNAHVVAEGVDPVPAVATARAAEVLTLSAHSPDRLRELAAQWLEFLPATEHLADACATARLGRPHRALRLAVSGRDAGELAAALRSWLLGEPAAANSVVSVRPTEADAPPAWLMALNGLPSARAVIATFEDAAGLPLARFSGKLVKLCAGVALGVVLRELGVPEEAVELPVGWGPVAAYVHGRTSLEQALAEVLAMETGSTNGHGRPPAGSTGLDVIGELADGADAESVLAGVVAALHSGGVEVDFAAFQGGAAWAKRALPAAQQRGRALDLAEPLRSAERGTPTTLEEDDGAHGYVFSRRYGPAETPIAQHSVYRTLMLPGVAWFDFLRQGVLLRGDVFHGVLDLVFHRPLILSEPTRVVCRVDGSGRFTVEDEARAPFVTGRFATESPSAGVEPLAEHLAACGRLHAGSTVYRWLRRIGYHHGRYYRNISWVASLPAGGTLARIEGERQRSMNPDDVELFPGLLDSVTIAAIDPDNRVFGADDASAFIPLSVDRMHLHGSLADAAFVRTEVSFWNTEACRVTQTVTDEHGKVLLVFGDISSKRVPAHAFTGAARPAAEAAPAVEPPAAHPAVVEPTAAAPVAVPRGGRTLAWFLAESGLTAEQADTEFLSTGFDSVGLVDLSDRLSKTHGLPLYPTVFFEYPTARSFAEYLDTEESTFTATLATPSPSAQAPATPPAAPTGNRTLTWFLAESGLTAEQADTEFLSTGFDSVGLVDLSDRLSKTHGLTLYPTVFFEYPTPKAFADYLDTDEPAFTATLTPRTAPHTPIQAAPTTPRGTALVQDIHSRESEGDSSTIRRSEAVADQSAQAAPTTGTTTVDSVVNPRDIAVVGAAIRVPTAETLEEFWQLLAEGRDTVRRLPDGRWDHPGPEASFLDRVDQFDPNLFRISAREAPHIDPQARLVYETIWQALEDAGRLGERAKGDRTGLWIGYSHDHYAEERARFGVANGRGLGLEAMIPNRFSHLMDWTGPSVVINTLCSSTLVALHTAMQHLRAGDIDTAVIGGVHAGISPEYFQSMTDLMALSPRARCRAFDDSADGFVPGEGAVAVVLRRHTDAGNDRVRGLIKGAAVNHGGRTTRYSAPSPRGQRQVITAALEDSGVSPESIGMVEAHGTGTSLGDPIEIEGLTKAWRTHTDRTQFCAIGSLKSNVGHLEPAAGLAGLVKVLLAMEHRQIPRTLHVERPNDHIRFEDSPFYIADRTLPWTDSPRRAAVSAFGMGGVNAHIIVEEPPRTPVPTPPRRDSHLVRVSGATEQAARDLAAAYAAHLDEATPLADFAHTANAGRAEQRFRAVGHGASAAELAESLAAAPVTRAVSGTPTAFLFTGQGSQYPDMGRGLYETEPVFRAALEECAELLRPHTELPLLELLYGSAQDRLTETANAQVGIVSVQVALLRLLAAWGIRPDMVAGHSVGELTAAHAAGAIALPDLMALTALRGRLMQAQPAGGGMAVVHADAATVAAGLAAHPGIEIAAHNSPNSTTVAGPLDAIAAFRAAAAHPTTQLSVSHAFHSAAMTGALAPFAEAVAATPITAPSTPIASTLTGTWHTASSIADPQVWAAAIRNPVRWTDAVGALHAAGAAVYWEIGPHPVLVPLTQACLRGAGHEYAHVLRRNRSDQAQLHAALAAHAARGGALDFAAAPGGQVTRIPGYPFDRARYWIARADGAGAYGAPLPVESMERNG